MSLTPRHPQELLSGEQSLTGSRQEARLLSAAWGLLRMEDLKVKLMKCCTQPGGEALGEAGDICGWGGCGIRWGTQAAAGCPSVPGSVPTATTAMARGGHRAQAERQLSG